MILGESAFLTTLIALTGLFLALAIFVQILQELYKYLTSHKARTYTKSLVDFMGPWSSRIVDRDFLPELKVRGPFQLARVRVRPAGKLLPLNREELAEVLERTTPNLVQRALSQLKLESELQGESSRTWSPKWTEFIDELEKTDPNTPGCWDAEEILAFLEGWHVTKDAAQGDYRASEVLIAFRSQFTPFIESVQNHYSQLMRNFDYSYRRRNLRLTFLFALVLVFAFNLPFNVVYHKAQVVSPAEAQRIVEEGIKLYGETFDAVNGQSQDVGGVQNSDRALGAVADPESGEDGNDLVAALVRVAKDNRSLIEQPSYSHFTRAWQGGPSSFIGFLFYSLVTAILVSFGAPFWNDLAKSLQRVQQGRTQTTHDLKE
jgi:hypothetical protein